MWPNPASGKRFRPSPDRFFRTAVLFEAGKRSCNCAGPQSAARRGVVSDGVGVFEQGDNFVRQAALMFGEFLPCGFKIRAQFAADFIDLFVNARGTNGSGLALGFTVFPHFTADVGEAFLEFLDAFAEGVLGVPKLLDRRETDARLAPLEEIVDLIDSDAERGKADDQPADGFI